MRFLYVAPRYHTNQVPIMRGLKKKGHEILFLSQYAGKVEDYSDLHPVVIGYSKAFRVLDRCYVKLMKKRDPRAEDRKIKCGFPPFGAMKREIRKFRPDVAILRERSVYSVFAYRICRKYGIPSILYNQSPLWENEIKNDPAHRLVRAFTPKVRMTPVYGVHSFGKVKEPGAAFVPFVMEAKLSPREKQWRRDGKTEIFVIGKYEKRKNQKMMLEVAAKLKSRYPIHLTVAGECSTKAHQEYYDSLVSYLKEQGMEEDVSLLKNLNRKQVEEQYRRSDLFVIPSTLEPASISQLEAMAFSLPVVCSDTNGTACYVENGKNGWQFRDNDKASLLETLEKMLADPAGMERMGTDSYRMICENCQIDAYLQGISELLSELKEMGTV